MVGVVNVGLSILSNCAIPVPDQSISEAPPILTEVWVVISKLKDGIAAGIYDIPAEMPKA